MPLMDWAASALVGILIAAVSSWITVQLSLQRFRNEKWWEKRVEAYERIIEALHDSFLFVEAELDAETDRGAFTEEQYKDMNRRYRAAQLEIQRAANVGAFMLSKAALSIIHSLRADLPEGRPEHGDMSWIDYFVQCYNATGKCLDDFISTAKRDLSQQR